MVKRVNGVAITYYNYAGRLARDTRDKETTQNRTDSRRRNSEMITMFVAIIKIDREKAERGSAIQELVDGHDAVAGG
jgi:Pyruvate/2-oxoacid:ferredoxin oxidoreductase gamma subunit